MSEISEEFDLWKTSNPDLIHSVCRICLQTANDPVNLFDGTPECKVILEKIYLCFQIIIHSENDLPHKLCSNCRDELNAAHNFRQNCVSFDERLAAFKIKEENFDMKNVALKNTINNLMNLPEIDYATNEDTNISNEKVVLDKAGQSSAKNLICNMCNKVLKTKSSLLKHITSMHQKRKHVGAVSGFGCTRRYNCTSCSYSTPHSQTLVNHMRTHDGARPYHCQCGKSFTQSSSLSAHQKTHSNVTYFTCSTCGKQFKHAYTLKKHSHVHENGKLVCNVCHKILKSKQSLQDHMYRHYNIRNYNCEDCGDTFVTSSELISHRKKHNLGKRVECYFCGYKTHTKKSLITHLKRYSYQIFLAGRACTVPLALMRGGRSAFFCLY